MYGSRRFWELIFCGLEKFASTVKVLAILGCILLVCGQLVLTQAPARKYLSYVDQLEGHRIYGEQVNYAEGPLEITEKTVTAAPGPHTDTQPRVLIIRPVETVTDDKVFVLVNGHDRFPIADGELVLHIQEGDVVEIDASETEQPQKFRIFAPHEDIAFPPANLTIEVKGDRAFIGAVRFKH